MTTDGIVAPCLTAPAADPPLVVRLSKLGTFTVHLWLWVTERGICLTVIVRGVARGWCDQTDVPSWSPTYLGAIAEEEAEINGINFRVTPSSSTATPSETGYKPTQIHRSQLTMLDGSFHGARGQHLVLRGYPVGDRPIVQSYVDVCLDGWLEIEAMYAPAKTANFAERFVRTTTNWGPPWINDRLYPWRPFIHVPRAWQIDTLLREVLGQAMFA